MRMAFENNEENNEKDLKLIKKTTKKKKVQRSPALPRKK
jgi:hypothetical protein